MEPLYLKKKKKDVSLDNFRQQTLTPYKEFAFRILGQQGKFPVLELGALVGVSLSLPRGTGPSTVLSTSLGSLDGV